MRESAIGWTDYSGSSGPWNIVTGCSSVDQSCAHCYARTMYKRWGLDFYTVRMHLDKLRRWYNVKVPKVSPKRGPGHRPMVFVVNTGDLFHADVQSWFVQEAFTIMAARYDVTWQVLTKRPVRMAVEAQMWIEKNGEWGHWPEHIWLGTSVCDQQTLDERLPILLDIPAQVRFLSVEPMLGPVSITDGAVECGLSWCIAGAESGGGRRRFDREWAQSLFRECRSMGLPFFGKQDTGLRPGEPLILWSNDGLAGVRQEWPRGDENDAS